MSTKKKIKVSVHVWGQDVAAFVGAPWCVVARLVSKAWRMHIPNLPMKPGVGPLKMTNVRLGKDTSVLIIENYVDNFIVQKNVQKNGDYGTDRVRVVSKGIREVIRGRLYIRGEYYHRRRQHTFHSYDNLVPQTWWTTDLDSDVVWDWHLCDV